MKKQLKGEEESRKGEVVQGDRNYSMFVGMHKSARAAITKYHRLGGFNNNKLLSHSSGGEKSEIKVAGCFFLRDVREGSVLGLFPFLIHGHLHIHMAFSLWVSVSNFPLL